MKRKRPIIILSSAVILVVVLAVMLFFLFSVASSAPAYLLRYNARLPCLLQILLRILWACSFLFTDYESSDTQSYQAD